MLKKLLILTAVALCSVASYAAVTSNGKVTGKYTGVAGEPEFTINYTATWNDNKTVTFNANITPHVDGLVPQMFVNNAYEGNMTGLGNNNYSYTSKNEHEEGTEPFAFYLAYAGGAVNVPTGYKVGSESDGSENPGPGETPDPTEPEEPVATAIFSGSEKGIVTQVMNEVSSDYPYVLNYTISYNEDKTLTIEASFEFTNGQPVGTVSSLTVSGIGENHTLARTGDVFSGKFTTTTQFDVNTELNINFGFAIALADVNVKVRYIVGSTSGPEVKLAAEAQNVDVTTAEIKYDVTLPEGYSEENLVVTYKQGEGEAVTATENPIKLSGLAEFTDYTYTLTATATAAGLETLTAETTVKFTTSRNAAGDMHIYNIINGFVNNSYLAGEIAEVSRRTFPISVKSDINYRADNTVEVSFEIFGHENIVGFVPQMNFMDKWSGSLIGNRGEDGVYRFVVRQEPNQTAEPVVFEPGTKGVPFWYMPCDGGMFEPRFPEITLGETNEPVEYGAPTEIVFTASAVEVDEDERVSLCVYMIDGNGNFVLTDKPTISFVEGSEIATLEGDFITLNESGSVTLQASYDGVSAQTITITTNSASTYTNLAKGILAEISEHGNDPQYATDDNEGTEVVFGCGTTENHTLKLDLTNIYNIEHITLIWEGACAKDYTITLETEKASEPKEIRAMAANSPYTITETGLEGGGGMVINKDYPVEKVPARFITLETTAAYNSDWGIKLKEIKVYGNPNDYTTGVESVVVDESAPVEYYNLQGVRVMNPSAGQLLIKKQGNAAVKVIF